MSDPTDQEDSENDAGESSDMTREELEKKVQEHMEKRKDAYVKMGTVDKPRD